MFNDKTILITGGTGSFGKKFVEMTLERFKPRRLIIYSRDEMKQYEMAKVFNDPSIRYFLGDIRDKDRLSRACQGVDYLVHAAALKIVPTAEYNPFEYIKTNVLGAMNIIDVAINSKVKKIVALSTDKACNPVNLYGATKLCSDKLFIAGVSYTGLYDTKFAIVRYGNVVGSRGSVVPFFREEAKKGSLPITDERMTRFWISLDSAVKLVYKAFEDSQGGEVFVPKIPSMKVPDLATAIAPDVPHRVIGIRPGEKLHETLITEDEARYTYDLGDHYLIMPSIYEASMRLLEQRREGCIKVKDGFTYSSDVNSQWLDVNGLKELINE